MDENKYQVDLLTALNERLMSSEKMYRHICECTGDLFMHFDYKITPPRVELIGPWDEALGEKIANHPYDESYLLGFLCDEDQDTFRSKILDAHRSGITKDSIEVRSRNKNHCYRTDVYITYDSSDRPVEKIVNLKDVTNHKQTSEELEYLAYYDSLTGVYNRNYFMTLLRDACEKALSEKTSVEVMFIDVDDFKKINDSVGLLFGDELIQELGHFLNDFNSDEVTVGRFGSDVFVLYVYNPCGTRSADVLYRKITERMRKPFVLSDRTEVYITVTAGVAEYPDAGKTSYEVMKNAEIVLYAAKDKGNSSISYFEPDILDIYNKNAELERDLNKAIDNEDLVLYYQPQYYSDNGNLRGVEILLRWPDMDSDGFKAEPCDFINIANKNLSIIQIGEWVLKNAIRNINEWRSKYHIPFKLCINVSNVQVKSEHFVEDLQNIVQMYELNPEMLEIEISESVFINELDEIIDKVKTIRGMGMKVAIDNFLQNSGSLKLLKEVEIDTIKIDRTFIEDSLTNDCASAIIEAVVALCKKLQIECVAFGVETKDQFNFLRKIDCDVIEGFLLGKPVPKSEFEKVLIRQAP